LKLKTVFVEIHKTFFLCYLKLFLFRHYLSIEGDFNDQTDLQFQRGTGGFAVGGFAAGAKRDDILRRNRDERYGSQPSFKAF
jgi:hypothetical protein